MAPHSGHVTFFPFIYDCNIHTLATSTFVFDDSYTAWQPPPSFSAMPHAWATSTSVFDSSNTLWQPPTPVFNDRYTIFQRPACGTMCDNSSTLWHLPPATATFNEHTLRQPILHFTTRLSARHARSPQKVHPPHPELALRHTISAEGCLRPS